MGRGRGGHGHGLNFRVFQDLGKGRYKANIRKIFMVAGEDGGIGIAAGMKDAQFMKIP